MHKRLGSEVGVAKPVRRKMPNCAANIYFFIPSYLDSTAGPEERRRTSSSLGKIWIDFFSNLLCLSIEVHFRLHPCRPRDRLPGRHRSRCKGAPGHPRVLGWMESFPIERNISGHPEAEIAAAVAAASAGPNWDAVGDANGKNEERDGKKDWSERTRRTQKKTETLSKMAWAF